MKKTLIGLLSLAAAFTAAAQDSEYTIYNNPDNAPFFGARIGVDITSTSGNDGIYNNGAGVTLGAVYNIPLWQNLYFEPGLSFFYDTFGMEIISGDDNYNNAYMIDGSIRNFGFRIPMLFGYFFDFTDDVRIAPFTGPQLNANITAKEHWNNPVDPIPNQSIFGEGGFKRLDIQWVIGVGVTYQKYYVALSGGLGMTKARSLKYDNFRRNNINISVGYNF